MTTRLWFVRHGPTHSKAAVGWTDIPADLSDLAALTRLSNYLPKEANIISSDLQRASATADAVQGARNRLPNTASLREMNFGDWDVVFSPRSPNPTPKPAASFGSPPAPPPPRTAKAGTPCRREFPAR